MDEGRGQSQVETPNYADKTVGWANADARSKELKLGIVFDAEEGPVEVTSNTNAESVIDKNAEGYEPGTPANRGSIVGVILVRREPRQRS